MRMEIPIVARCCCCLPLRPGLLAWGYFKLVSAILLMVFTTLSMIRFIMKSYPASYLVFGAIAIVLLTLEIVFGILFLVSAHRKNDVYLRVYYRYAISILILEVICLLLYVGFEVFLMIDFPFVIFIIQFMVQTTCFVFAMIVLQIYFIILVRSEIQKLQNNSKFEFVNHTSDPVCKVVI